jgi:hypothetical protein
MKQLLGVVALSWILVVISGAPVAAQAPSIEGTYRLVARDLPDGTRIEPPALDGLLTYTKTLRNFNIYWKDAEGKTTSISTIRKYTLTEDGYSETNIFHMANDEIGGTGVTYDFSQVSGGSSVNIENGRIEFDLPLFDEPRVVFEGDKLSASVEGEFVDQWERVE